MLRVIVLDNIAKEGMELLDAAPGIAYEVRTGLTGDALRQALLDYDGAICRSGVKVGARAVEGNRKLRAIVRAGVGTDNIDKAAATRQGIVVMNTPTGNTVSTAEHTFALMLGLSRNLAPANQSLKDGRWDRKAYMGVQLANKTLGIVGLGRIGQEVAKRAVAFQMRVMGYDPFLSHEQAKRLGVEPVESVREMLPKIDYLTVHTPLTSETRDLIGTEEIALLKPGARLINCARGGIYNEAALQEGLSIRKLGGVALDVYGNEPCTDSPLFRMPDTLCTPHLGASTEEAQTQVAVEAVQLLVNFLRTGEIRHAVNMVAVDPTTMESLRGYLDVAYRLGLLLTQWHEGLTESCLLRYAGQVTQRDTKLLTAAFCAGLLERALESPVNNVNAEMLLQERGIKLSEQLSHRMGAFSSSMTAEVTGDGSSSRAGGTLFGNSMPRLVRMDNYRLEAYLDGHLLLFSHEDVPGIIGAVGTILGRHQVNIAQMAVGRERAAPGGPAIGVLNLDSPLSQEALEEVLNVKAVHRVKHIVMPARGELPPWLR
jgi:D-3-phosphoglycerate dehydrogenase